MAEPAVRNLVVADFDHELRAELVPCHGLSGCPTARSAWYIAGKPGAALQRFQPLRQDGAFGSADGGGKPDMIEFALCVSVYASFNPAPRLPRNSTPLAVSMNAELPWLSVGPT